MEPGLACGSDTAHLSILGYDPRKYARALPGLALLKNKLSVLSILPSTLKQLKEGHDSGTVIDCDQLGQKQPPALAGTTTAGGPSRAWAQGCPWMMATSPSSPTLPPGTQRPALWSDDEQTDALRTSDPFSVQTWMVRLFTIIPTTLSAVSDPYHTASHESRASLLFDLAFACLSVS